MTTIKRLLILAAFLLTASSMGASLATEWIHPVRFKANDCRVTVTWKLVGTVEFERMDPDAPAWQQMTCPEGIW